MQKLNVLWSQNAHKKTGTGQVTGRSTQTCHKTNLDRIGAGREDNGDRFGCTLRCERRVKAIECVTLARGRFGARCNALAGASTLSAGRFE